MIAGAARTTPPIAIELTCAAKEAGADAALNVPPYYNRPEPGGRLPPILPRSPRRPNCRSSSTTCRRAPSPTSRSRRWRGSSGIPRCRRRQGRDRQLEGVRPPRRLRPRLVQLSGNDDMALGFNAMGGRAASRSPRIRAAPCADFQNAMAQATGRRRLKLHDKLFPLHAALFTDASPGPVKYALTASRRLLRPSCACR